MFSLTLRTKPEAKLPKAARHSCDRSLGHAVGRLPARGWYRGSAALVTTASHVVPGTPDCLSNGVGIALQNPGALS